MFFTKKAGFWEQRFESNDRLKLKGMQKNQNVEKWEKRGWVGLSTKFKD